LLSGCGYYDLAQMQADQNTILQRQKITTKFAANPDTDTWYQQRQQMTQALGDRDFNQDFNRVFDSLTVAISSLELKVTNMERESGYIEASGITLPPSDAKALRSEAVNNWCTLNGFDPSVLDRPLQSSQMQQYGDMMDMTQMTAKYDTMQKSVTFQLVKMSDQQTRVKLRFSDVYYPPELEAYYKLIWQAVDKQIFVDKTIEGSVENRQ